MDSLCPAVNFNIEREVSPHATFLNKGSAGLVIKAMIKQSQRRCELAFIPASSSLGFFLYTVDKGTGEGKNLSNNKESLKCGNNILLVTDERPFSSQSSESSICPQISATGAAEKHLQGASSLLPLEDDCSPGQAMVWLWAHPLGVTSSPQDAEASTEPRSLVAA